MSRRDPWPLVLAALAIASRIPFIPSTLYDFDAAAFAEALRSFSPILFHPHPPGYTFYVWLTKCFQVLGLAPEATLAAASVAAGAATAVALYRFGRALASREAGIVATLLYLSSPLAWTYGSAQGTYGYGALGAVLVAHASWLRLRGARISPALLGLGAGAAAGFRPDVAVVLSPLLAAACLLGPTDRGRARAKSLGAAILGGVAGLAMWIVPAIVATGGWGFYRETVVRQWEAVAFSNAENRWTWLTFRLVNAVKLAVYGGFALGPLGALLLLWSGPRVMRDFHVEPATKLTLGAWLGGYALLSVLVAFGQPGMLLTALPAACLAIGIGLVPGRDQTRGRLGARVGLVAAGVSALAFLTGAGLSERGFFDASASLPAKLATELRLFTRPGLALVDREQRAALEAIRAGHPPQETLVVTNVASATRMMYSLPEYPVTCYFAFAGFEAPIPSRAVGEPVGTYPIPHRARWLVLVDVDRHSISVEDQIGDRVRPQQRARAATSGMRVIDLTGVYAVRFVAGRIELVPS